MTNNHYQHLVYDQELMLYPYAPLGVLHNVGKWPTPKYSYSIVITISSHERHSINEWLNYHHSLGFEHIYIYCHDEDPTDLYRAILPFTLGKNPFVTFHHYRFKGNGYFYHFLRNYLHETQWYIALTHTDYMCIRQNKSLSEFMEHYRGISFIYFNIVSYKIDETNKTPLHSIEMSSTPHYTARIMVKSTALPYQSIFEHIDTIYYYHLHSLAPNVTACNVIFVDMHIYYQNFPYDLFTYLENHDECRKILNTAYIAKSYDSSSDQEDNLSIFHTPLPDGDNINHEPVFKKDFYLQQYWKQSLAPLKQQSILPETNWTLLSENKSCIQITNEENNTQTPQDASFLINGELTGFVSDQNISNKNPIYIIDLYKIFIIKEIRLFNKLNADYHFTLIIKSSNDQQSWSDRYTKTNNNLFGGVNGNPFIWVHPLGFQARYVQFQLQNSETDIILDQIQILGTPINKL